MKLSNKWYDRIKWVAQYFLPAFTTLWLAVGKIWSLPYTVEIGATLSAIDIFLGGVLGISSKNYDGDGEMVVNTKDPNKDVYSLNLNMPVEDLANKKTITFTVNKAD